MPPPTVAASSAMDAAGMLRSLDSVKTRSSTLGEATDHVWAPCGHSPAAVRVAYDRSRREGPQWHAMRKLSSNHESIPMAVTQAISVNNVSLSLRQMHQTC